MPIPDASPEQVDACSEAADEALDQILAASLAPTAEGRRSRIAAALDAYESKAGAFEDEDKWVYERWRFAFVMSMCQMMRLDAEFLLAREVDDADSVFFSLEARDAVTNEPVNIGDVDHDPASEGQAVAFQMATCALNGQQETCMSLWGALMERPHDDTFQERSGYAILLLSYLAARVRLKVMHRSGILPELARVALETVMAQEPYGDLGL